MSAVLRRLAKIRERAHQWENIEPVCRLCHASDARACRRKVSSRPAWSVANHESSRSHVELALGQRVGKDDELMKKSVGLIGRMIS